MARPDFNARRSNNAGANQSSNFISRWITERNERKKAAENEASRLITNKIAQNETTIIEKLNSIDFLNSNLPKEILEAKKNENQRYGDLQHAAKAIAAQLLNNPQPIKIAIRAIDEKLLTLVLLYKQAVEQGDVRAAYAAKGGLVRGINDIRCRIPQEQPHLAKLFVESNAKYLEEWITLVNMAQLADRLKQNVDEVTARYKQDRAQKEAETKALHKRLTEDNEYMIAFNQILEHDTPEERAKWTDLQREVHVKMVEDQLKRVRLDLNAVVLQQKTDDYNVTVNRVELLYDRVASMKVVYDPDLINKFNEQVEAIFKEMAESDVALNESLQMMEDIEGRLRQLDNAPGTVRAREVAFESANKTMDEITKLQEVQNGKNVARAHKIRENLGIKNEQELELMRKQGEEEMLRAKEEAVQQAEQTVDEQEGETLYN